MASVSAFASPLTLCTTRNSTKLDRRCRRTRPSYNVRPVRAILTTRASADRERVDDETAVEMLHSSDFVERIRGVNVLSTARGETMDVPARVEALLPVARDDRASQVRFCALSALAAQAPDKIDTELQSTVLETARHVLIEDTEMSCRCGAADVIAALRLGDGFSDLVDAYRSDWADWMLRLSIVAGMGVMGHEDSFAFLQNVVEEDEYAKKESLVLAAAVGALGDLGDMRALPIVQRFAGAEDEAVRERATIALEMLQSNA